MNAMNDFDQDPLNDAPLLRSVPRTDPFEVPEGFFDRFPELVMAKVERPLPLWLRAWNTWWKAHPALRIASIALVIGAFAMPFMNMNGGQGSPDVYAGLETEAVRPDAVEALFYDDESLMAALATDDEAFAAVGHGVSDEALAAYVDQQDLPLEQIIEEL